MTVDARIVFGSCTEGTATAESDSDVIVVSDAFATMSADERLWRLEGKLLDACS